MGLDYANALLLDVSLPKIIRLERENTVLHARLKRTNADIKGNDVIITTQIQGEQGIGSVARGGTLPTASPAEYLKATATLKYHYATITLYGQDRILSEGQSNERIASILSEKVMSIGETYATDFNRQLWGDGTGVLSYAEATTGPTTIINVSNIMFFRLGMPVDIWDASASAYETTGDVITAITDDGDGTGKITLTTGITNSLVTDDTIYRSGSKGNELTGITAAIASTGTYLGINRATYPQWRSYLKSVGGPLTIAAIDEFFGKLMFTYQARPSIIYTDEPTMRWVKYLYQEQGIPLNYQTIELGYTGVRYTHPLGSTVFAVEPFCPAATMWAIDERYFTLRQPAPQHWMPGYNGYWRMDGHVDREIATLRHYAELFLSKPDTCGKLYGYTTPIT